jgi:hypothetical protein
MICCCLTDKESGFCRGLSREGLKRIRGELGWRGKLVMLIESGATGEDGTSHDELCTPAGLKRIAEVLEGVGPPIGRIVTWNSTGVATVTALVKDAHAAGLVVHPPTRCGRTRCRSVVPRWLRCTWRCFATRGSTGCLRISPT